MTRLGNQKTAIAKRILERDPFNAAGKSRKNHNTTSAVISAAASVAYSPARESVH